MFILPTSTEHIQNLCKVLEVGSSTGVCVVMSVLQLDVRGMQVLGCMERRGQCSIRRKSQEIVHMGIHDVSG